MTKTELLAKLALEADNCDTDVAHATADRLLLEYINDSEITAAWEAVDKWYA